MTLPPTPLGPGVEFDRIRAIVQALGNAGAGLGDDCAVVEIGGSILALSTDASVEGVHFRHDWLSLEEIGWRAGAGALSDLAAVGAAPVGALVALTVPRSADPGVETAVMRGVGAACESVGAAVLGGDLTGGPGLAIVVTVVGSVERPVRRAGARPGDALWVTGGLGGARAALVSWRAGRTPPPDARAAFARPVPRIAAGRWAAGAGATSMIDVSDGLAGDAAHLAAAGAVGLDVRLDRLPLGPGVAEAAASEGEPPSHFAARGGEDYELLFTLPAGVAVSGCPVAATRIGAVREGQGLRLLDGGRPIALTGFDHFA